MHPAQSIQSCLWVGIGGALGSLARYWCSGWIARHVGETFPWGTLGVNVIGSFAIGGLAALTAPDSRFLISPSLRQFFMIGLCGGYTTFSSFSIQTLELMHAGEWFHVALNILFSVAFCLLAVCLGYWTGSTLAK